MRRRQKQEIDKEAYIKQKKNFFPTLIVTAILWSFIISIVYFVDPSLYGIVPVFLFLFFMATLFTFSIIFAHGRRGLITASAITLYLILGYLEVGNVINLILVAGVAIALEVYLTSQNN